MRRILSLLYRGQEFALWLPCLTLLSLAGFVVFGALTPMTGDVLAWLAELPVICAHAAAALGAAWAAKALYMHDLDRAEEIDLHNRVLAGDAAARWVLVKDRLETLACIALSLLFFWPPR